MRPKVQSLLEYAAKTLVQAFIFSRLDYCNEVLYGITDNLCQRLQSVHNAAARLIIRIRRREHNHIRYEGNTLAACPTPGQIQARHAHELTLHGMAPSYLSDECQLVSHTSRHPLSSNRHHLSYDACFDVRGEIIRTVLCCGVY